MASPTVIDWRLLNSDFNTSQQDYQANTMTRTVTPMNSKGSAIPANHREHTRKSPELKTWIYFSSTFPVRSSSCNYSFYHPSVDLIRCSREDTAAMNNIIHSHHRYKSMNKLSYQWSRDQFARVWRSSLPLWTSKSRAPTDPKSSHWQGFTRRIV